VFGTPFVELYRSPRPPEHRLNYFLIALYFGQLKSGGGTVRTKNLAHFAFKCGKINEGFRLSPESAQYIEAKLGRLSEQYDRDLLSETADKNRVYQSIYDEIVGYFPDRDGSL
jgi:hypothetical protein